MIFFYLRGALRNLRRNSFYSLINIGCLAVGLAVSMTILLYVLHEHSYDRWQANADRTFSTWGTFHFGNSEWHSGAVTYVTAPMLQTGVDVNLPQAKAQTIPDDEGKLILTVTKDKRVFLGKLQIQWDDVEKTLKNNAKLNADHELYLHADKDLPYGEVVKVMAAVKQAGVDKLGMVTDPLE